MAASDFVAPRLTGEKKDSGPPGLLGLILFPKWKIPITLLGSNLSAKEKYAERMKKLRDLHMKRNEARKINHQEVVDEDKRWESILNPSSALIFDHQGEGA